MSTRRWAGNVMPYDGRIGSVIFRVTGQDREDLQTRRSLFYVLGVKQDSACVVGRVGNHRRGSKVGEHWPAL